MRITESKKRFLKEFINMQELLKEIKYLNLPENDYAIYGSGPMAIRSIREANDLDLMVRDEFYEELKNKYKEEVEGKLELGQGKIEIFPAWNSLVDNPEEVIDRAELIKGFKFVRLDDLIDWKRKMGRDKDFKDIRLIENFLQSGSVLSKRN